MMRKFYVLLIALMLGFTTQAQDWLMYTADVLPSETEGETFDLSSVSSDSPGDNFSQGIVADPDIDGNDLLEYLQPDDDAKTMYRSYMPDDWAGTAFTIVARIKGIADGGYDRNMDIQWRNGNSGTRDELRISPVDSTIQLAKSDVEVKVDKNLYGWHTYRIVVDGDVAAVYIDEADTPALEATSTSGTSDNYIKFGDESGDLIGGYLDWMVMWLGDENPALPAGLTGVESPLEPKWYKYMTDVLPAETEDEEFDLSSVSSDSPGENFSQSIVEDPDIAGNNLLEYLQPDDDAKTMYRSYFPDEWTGTAFTIVARIKGITDGGYDRNMDIQWRNGNSGTRDELRISPADSTIALSKSDIEVKVEMNLYDWHTYRIVVDGDVAAVYIDEADTPVVEATSTSGTSDNYIKFGDESGDLIGGYLDWMLVWLGEENPELPEGLTGIKYPSWLAYFGDVMPADTEGEEFDLSSVSSDSPGENFSQSIIEDPDIDGNNLLEYLQPDDDAKTMYRSYMPDDWTGTAFTIVARIKGIADGGYDRNMDIQWRNGNSGTRDELRISPVDSTIQLAKSDVEVKVDKNLYGWHTYRIVVDGDVAAVYIDEADTPALEATSTSGTSDNYIKFGDESGDLIGGYLDWMVVWLGDENPELPDYLTGRPLGTFWLGYTADVLPAATGGNDFDLTSVSSNSPGANFTQTIVDDPDKEGNKLLEYLQPDDDAKTMYRSYMPEEWTETNFTIVARIKGVEDGDYDRAMDIQWRNGNSGTRDELRISPSDSTLELAKSDAEVKVDMNLYDWHTYRIVITGDVAAVYIDEAAESAIEATSTSGTSDNYIKFGDESGDLIGGYLDWMVVWLGHENPALPEFVSGAPEKEVHEESSDARLAELVPSAGELTPEFSPYTNEYSMLVDLANESISFNAVASHDSATVSENFEVTEFPSTVEITVTAEDGSTNTYTVAVEYYYPSDDATLASLAATKGEFNVEFSVDVYEYTLTVPEGTNSLLLSANVNDANATVTGDGLITDIPSEVAIVVTAEDGTELTYTVTIEVKTGVDELASAFKVFPTPAVNYLNITTGVEQSNLTIFNIAGEKVLHRIIGDSNTLDISNFERGVYMISVKNDSYSKYMKFIKE
jgi:hypothetical protein